MNNTIYYHMWSHLCDVFSGALLKESCGPTFTLSPPGGGRRDSTKNSRETKWNAFRVSPLIFFEVNNMFDCISTQKHVTRHTNRNKQKKKHWHLPLRYHVERNMGVNGAVEPPTAFSPYRVMTHPGRMVSHQSASSCFALLQVLVSLSCSEVVM